MPDSFLCFDYGLKRIGVAVGNDLTQSAQELKPLKARDGVPDWHHIESLLKEWQPSAVVVGLPLNMDGTESELSTRARKFGRRIHGRYHIEVHMQDERLSSFEAKEITRQTHGYQDFGEHSVDGLAACLVLESWFSNRTQND